MEAVSVFNCVEASKASALDAEEAGIRLSLRMSREKLGDIIGEEDIFVDRIIEKRLKIRIFRDNEMDSIHSARTSLLRLPMVQDSGLKK